MKLVERYKDHKRQLTLEYPDYDLYTEFPLLKQLDQYIDAIIRNEATLSTNELSGIIDFIVFVGKD